MVSLLLLPRWVTTVVIAMVMSVSVIVFSDVVPGRFFTAGFLVAGSFPVLSTVVGTLVGMDYDVYHWISALLVSAGIFGALALAHRSVRS